MELTPITPQKVREAIQATGGWEGKLAAKYGLYRQLIEGWERSGQVPRAWRLALKSAIKANKAKGVEP